MDGEYQCNRNGRANLEFPDQTTTKLLGEIDFKVRQKEVLRPDGSMWGRQWRFSKLAGENEPTLGTMREPPHMGGSVGTIEVLVLRCALDDNLSESSGLLGPPPDTTLLGLKPRSSTHTSGDPAQSRVTIPGAWPLCESYSTSYFHLPSPQGQKTGAWSANQKLNSSGGNTDIDADPTEHEETLFAMHLHSDVVDANITSHQVRPGKAAPYLHRLVAPKYLDTQAQPYASFVFKYRGAGT